MSRRSQRNTRASVRVSARLRDQPAGSGELGRCPVARGARGRAGSEVGARIGDLRNAGERIQADELEPPRYSTTRQI